MLVTGAGGVVRVFDVPSLAVRAEHAERDTHLAALSAGGRALLVLTAGDELLVHAGAGWHVHPAPRGRREVLGVAVADDGGSAALLTADGLERWALPAAGAPEAALALGPVARGWLAADGELRLVAAGGAGGAGEPEPLGAWELDSGRALWTAGGAPPVSLLPFAGRVWGVWADRLAGLAPGADPLELSGTAGEQLAFAPSGRHLLAWRGDGPADGGAIPVLLRVLDAATGAEAERRRVPVRGLPGTILALADDLGVLALRAREDGGVDATGL